MKSISTDIYSWNHCGILWIMEPQGSTYNNLGFTSVASALLK